MEGKCSPRGVGLYTIENEITVSFNMRQIWNFKYGMVNGKTVVKVSRDNVRLYLSKEEFEKDWGCDDGREND